MDINNGYKMVHTLFSGREVNRFYETKEQAMDEWDELLDYVARGEKAQLFKVEDDVPKLMSTFQPAERIENV